MPTTHDHRQDVRLARLEQQLAIIGGQLKALTARVAALEAAPAPRRRHDPTEPTPFTKEART